MTEKPTAQIDTTPALRHVVYADLLSMLPMASYRQAQRFAANLALCRNRLDASDVRRRRNGIFRIMQRLLLLRVTPELAEVKPPTLNRREIEQHLTVKYGERLNHIAGFYSEEFRTPNSEFRIRLNLPEGCALYGYRSRVGFYDGIICQPLDRIDFFFVLSSRNQGGYSPVRMTEADRELFERFKEPVKLSPALEALRQSIPPLDMTGYRFNGRRFVEVKTV